MNVDLTDDQIIALYKLMDWYSDPKSSQVFTIDGTSGSGKSTLIAAFAEYMNLTPGDYIYSCFTGKAVNVLSSKGVPACTIHRLIYYVQKIKKNKKTEYKFILKEPNELKYKLIILDEYSMIGDKLFEDLLSFGIKIVLTGDSNQLPPVNDNKIDVNFDAELRQVVRQAKDSPILKLASKVLNDEPIGYGALSEKVMVVHKEDIPDELLIDPKLQIICGYNTTRMDINKKIRKLKGNYTRYPVPGDRLVCTSNDWSLLVGKNMALTNGMQGTLLDIKFPEDGYYPDDELALNPNKKKDPRWWVFYAQIQFDGVEEPTSLYINRACFDNQYQELIDEENGHWFEFGYAMSCHKSQGSEYDNVLVIYEPVGDPKRWLYTAITRAKEGLILAL